MGGLQALGEAALGVAVERRPEVGKGAYRRGAFLGQHPGHGGVHQARAGRDRVGGVQSRGVALGKRRGHPALRPGRRAAMVEWGVGDHQHLARRGGERGGQAREARADDDHAVM